MEFAIRFAEAFCLFTAFVHFTTLLATGLRPRLTAKVGLAPADAPAISVVRPVCGLEYQIEATLRSTFLLDYPRYEILFCVASERDPVVPLVRAFHRQVPARLLVGDDPISINPKLNNIVKGWEAAIHDWIVMADSNVLMPRDYLARLFAEVDHRTALVSAPPLGSEPDGVWAELECAFLNTYQARWQLAAAAFGFGFAHGKNMLWRRAVLEDAGGIRALAAEPAEDAAGTKIVRARGMKVRVVPDPFPQPLGARRFADVWRRQLRWARLRRASFKLFFVPEILSGGFLPLVGLVFLVATGAVPTAAALVGVGAWYGGEYALSWSLGWPLSLRAPLLAVLRDAMLPWLWVAAIGGSTFVWRGNAMSVRSYSPSPGELQLAEE